MKRKSGRLGLIVVLLFVLLGCGEATSATSPVGDTSKGEADPGLSAEVTSHSSDVNAGGDGASTDPIDGDAASNVTPMAHLPLAATGLFARRGQTDVVWLPSAEYHTGDDLLTDWQAYWAAQPSEVMARAAHDGVIVHAGPHYGLGNTVTLLAKVDGKVYYFQHGHLDSVLVAVDDQVEQGEALGVVGTSGAAGPCPHIHLQVLHGSRWDQTLAKSGLGSCGLHNPPGATADVAMVRDSCFHYYSPNNQLGDKIDAVYTRPGDVIDYPAHWAAMPPGYPYTSCANACSTFCFDLSQTPKGCSNPGTTSCEACVSKVVDPRCGRCPGIGCSSG